VKATSWAGGELSPLQRGTLGSDYQGRGQSVPVRTSPKVSVTWQKSAVGQGTAVRH